MFPALAERLAPDRLLLGKLRRVDADPNRGQLFGREPRQTGVGQDLLACGQRPLDADGSCLLHDLARSVDHKDGGAGSGLGSGCRP